ncbi:MAG TPA: chromosome segregation protein SMC [Gemmatimonadales bacterium]|nr:chromosome segregation protein SMC [Gemmatimonadales bacterium]
MKLTRLTLSGFKSFATTVELAFDEGVTAIVGPNGCGKSNISDAVRWVLGEQRTRVLRGQRMEEVIFHGSAKRKPVNIAEVTLTFDNSSGILPISYATVEIGRRLSRNGQSDYVINQSSVRLRDVQDLLRGTGLGSDAGVVMEAGMIDRLLSDRAEERRSLFEEAARIGLYRDRKTVTERRLEKTTEDLTRLDDLISEVQTQVRSLARQRGRAERHQQFAEERFAIVMTLARHDLAEFDRRSAELAAEREALTAGSPEHAARLQAAERQREAAVLARATAEARRSEVERRLAQAQLDVGRLEGDLALASERLEHAASRAARARAERDEARERAAQAARELAAATAERSAAHAARVSVQTELDLRTASETDARERLAAQREQVRTLEAQRQQAAEEERALVGERSVAEREVADLREQIGGLEQRLAEAEAEYTAARAEETSARAALELREREHHAAVGELERARHALAAAREHEAALRIEGRAATEALAQVEARREALEGLERERVGLAPAARALLDARTGGRFREGDVLGPLSDFVHASTADARRAERLLGEWLHAVLVRDESVVDVVAQWHADGRHGPLLLLPLAPGPRRQASGLPDELVVDSPARDWVATLLAGDAALDPDARAIRRASGAVYLAGDTGPGGGGPIARRAELDALRAEVEGTRERVSKLHRDIEVATQQQEEAERALEAATAAAERARTTLHEAQVTSDAAARRVARAGRERGEVADGLARARSRLEAGAARLRQIGGDETAAAQRRRRLEQSYASAQAILTELESAQELARERRVHWQVEEAQVAARAEAALDRERRALAAKAEAEETIARLDAELAAVEQESREVAEQRSRWHDELAERRLTTQQLEKAVTDAAAALAVAEQTLAQAESELERLRAESLDLREREHRLALAAADLNARRNAMVERIEGEWHRPIAHLLATAPEVAGDPAALRAEAERLAQAIEAMGPVNPLAVEEHAEETKRLEFLTSQRDDLVHARNTLLEAIREIDATARQMFTDTFAAIQGNFSKVFQTLFEGGECDIRLADENDPLGSDIEIRAAPRGKRTQRIHLLSSGERTLVAISLLFAIYLTKPSPFCLLDEVDAPLDDANVARFVRLLDEFKSETQFIVITHNPRTMQAADAVYGITMQEPGVSTIVGVRLGEAASV